MPKVLHSPTNRRKAKEKRTSLLKKPVNKGKQMFSSSTGPVTRATTRSSKLKQCFLMTKAIILQNQKSYRKYSVFLPVIVFFFKRGYRTAGEEFVEKKRGFCWEHAPSQKPLSVFTQQSHFKRFELIFEG
jgi:hypothetical protein